MADARDLKSCDTKVSYRFEPGFRHQFSFNIIYRGVEQLVARRAHNPEVRRFKSPPRNQKKTTHSGGFSFGSAFGGGRGLNLLTSGKTPDLALRCRANNLRPKRKRLIIVFATVDGTKQGAEEASDRATHGDYATAE